MPVVWRFPKSGPHKGEVIPVKVAGPGKRGPVLTRPTWGNDTGPLHPDHVRVRSFDPDLVVECRRGEEPPRIKGGYGGWEQVTRPEKMPLTIWQGSPPYQMEVQLLLDGWRDGISVEPAVAILERMGRAPGGDEPPPLLNVRFPSGSPRSSGIEWVIENLDWGDSIENRNGERVRQLVTVTLLQFVEDELLQTMRKRRKRRKTRTYTVKKQGETLATIAKHFKLKIGTVKGLNRSIRDPRKELKKGQKVKLPTGKK